MNNKTKALFVALGLLLGTGMSFASATFASSHSDTGTRERDSTSTSLSIDDATGTNATATPVLESDDDAVNVRGATSIIGSKDGDTHEQNDRNHDSEDGSSDDGFDD